MEIQFNHKKGDRIKFMKPTERVLECVCPFCNGHGYRIIYDRQIKCLNCKEGTFKDARESEKIKFTGKIISISCAENENGIIEPMYEVVYDNFGAVYAYKGFEENRFVREEEIVGLA